jgi:hypothetical protein
MGYDGLLAHLNQVDLDLCAYLYAHCNETLRFVPAAGFPSFVWRASLALGK